MFSRGLGFDHAQPLLRHVRPLPQLLKRCYGLSPTDLRPSQDQPLGFWCPKNLGPVPTRQADRAG